MVPVLSDDFLPVPSHADGRRPCGQVPGKSAERNERFKIVHISDIHLPRTSTQEDNICLRNLREAIQFANLNDSKINAIVDADETTGEQLMTGVIVPDDGVTYIPVQGTVDNTDDSTEALYYFGDEETDGSMKTGKNIKIELDDGETYTFGFEKNGKAIDGLEGKTKIYKNGLLLTASSDYNYQALNATFKDLDDDDTMPDEYVLGEKASVEFVKTSPNPNYVISKSGSVVRDGSYVKDADGNYYAVNDDGEVAFYSYDDDYARNKAQEFARYGSVCGEEDEENDRWDNSNCN